MCAMLPPMSCSSGMALVSASSLPPHMIESDPALAPTSPPDTGASSANTLPAWACSAILSARLGVEVVMSTSTPPGLSEARTPSCPRVTDSTSEGAPTMVNTMSAPAAASFGEAQSLAPADTRSSHLEAVRLYTLQLWPPSRRWRHMCFPMTPTPTHATRIPMPPTQARCLVPGVAD